MCKGSPAHPHSEKSHICLTYENGWDQICFLWFQIVILEVHKASQGLLFTDSPVLGEKVLHLNVLAGQTFLLLCFCLRSSFTLLLFWGFLFGFVLHLLPFSFSPLLCYVPLIFIFSSLQGMLTSWFNKIYSNCYKTKEHFQDYIKVSWWSQVVSLI